MLQEVQQQPVLQRREEHLAAVLGHGRRGHVEPHVADGEHVGGRGCAPQGPADARDELAGDVYKRQFLNFSRDVLVDDAAMAEALASGKVAAYVTDFANPAVVKMERAIVIPHLGASTAEAEDNCAKMAVEEIMAYLERGEKIHCVNM